MVKVLSIVMVVGACVFAAEGLTEQRIVTIDQSKANFKVVQRNVSARSIGAFVIMAGAAASPATAVDRLVKKAALTEGSSRALVNLVIDKRLVFFLIGTATIITARADVVEFIPETINEGGNQ